MLPNIASTLIVSMTLAFPEIFLRESGLSFLGLGVQPPATSLASMVGYGREYLTTAPWVLLAPAITIILTTFAVAILGDWLRDRLDATLRREFVAALSPPRLRAAAADRGAGALCADAQGRARARTGRARGLHGKHDLQDRE